MSVPAHAFWIWTPETNKWVNPKYAVKESPSEQLDFAKEFYDKGDCKDAVKEFNKLLKHYPRAREAPEAQYYIAQCVEKEGDLFKAFKAYQEVIEKYPFSERSAQIIKRQYEIGNELLEGGRKSGSWKDAFTGTDYNIIEIFRAVIKNAPYSEYAAPSQYKIGLYLLENNLYQEARDEFDKVVSDYPDSEWTKAARYQIAVADARRSTGAQYDQKVTQSAVKEFENFVENNPDAKLSDEAKSKIFELREKEAENNFLVGQFYEKHKKYNAAKVYYEVVVDDFGDSTWAPKALEKIRQMGKMQGE